jgi:hypothetical protein
MTPNALVKTDAIRQLIYTFRGIQVMIDRDLSTLYGVETRVLNQAVRRNQERFPKEFCFQLADEEFKDWKSQIVMSNNDKMGLRRPPYAFTEEGVAMLSAVLRSKTAVNISIQIMNAFVQMRRFLADKNQVFQRLETVERRQLEADSKFKQIFDALEERQIIPEKGVFFDGQIFDAHVLVSKIIRNAKKSIVLIDNYIDENVLILMAKRNKQVTAEIYTKSISRQLQLDIKKHNQQYPPVMVKEIKSVHDRFLIVDGQTVYHIGASLKDLGKKWFAFSKMGKEGWKVVERVSKCTKP